VKYLFQLTSFVFIVLSSLAFTQVSALKPAAELKKLDYFVGTWTLEGEFKPGAMGPAEKVSGTDRYEWMEGGFFLAGHSDFKSADGNGSSLAVMGYNTQDGIYTYDSFNSMGDAEHAKGSLSADTWIWTAHAKIGTKDTQSRYVVKVLSPTWYSFQHLMSEDGYTWTTVIEGKATKVK
jgi:hypothetical protein